MNWKRLIGVWLLVGVISVPTAVVLVVVSGYRLNPWIAQMLFLGACNLVIVWNCYRWGIVR